MNKLEAYLARQDRIIAEDRDRTLINLGLVEKEYAPDDYDEDDEDYDHYEYANGEKRYYREVALKVTDEEYELIIDRYEKVKAIEDKKELIREQENIRKSRCETVKELLPVFDRKKLESSPQSEENMYVGKSGTATLIRIFAWICCIIVVIAGIVVSFNSDSYIVCLYYILIGVGEVLLLSAIAKILDYFAEITEILRNGFRYSETNELKNKK